MSLSISGSCSQVRQDLSSRLTWHDNNTDCVSVCCGEEQESKAADLPDDLRSYSHLLLRKLISAVISFYQSVPKGCLGSAWEIEERA